MNDEVILIIALLFFIALSVFCAAKHNKLYEKYKDIIDIEKEKSKQNILLEQIKKEIRDLQNTYKSKYHTYEELNKELSFLEGKAELNSVGLYEPFFNFDSSEKYKSALQNNYNRQKKMVQEKKAVLYNNSLTLDGSAKKAERWAKKWMKLALRAFNGECEAIISKVRWNNIKIMEERIFKAFEQINETVENAGISITDAYFRLKLDELRLTYEEAKKKQDEKEEQRRIRELQKEEERRQKEIEKAQQEAEKEISSTQKALKKKEEEASGFSGAEAEKYKAEIEALKRQLEEATAKKERALAQAQLTRAGHIYVISNIGSFGESVYKIGMTRRLDPLERVNELGDASVPFKFDVHALIYSEDAPALETSLHKAFADKKVNMVNDRREFFRVSLDEIEKEVHKNFAQIEFIKEPEAEEYRETLAIKNKTKAVESLQENKHLPSEI